jgi:hypothetical protein
MIDGKITIGGVEHPYRRSLGAFHEFDLRWQSEGVSIFKTAPNEFTLEQSAYLIYCIVKSGHIVQGTKFELTAEQLFHMVGIEEMNDFVKQGFGLGGEAGAEKKT